jgi:hypothetical protein
MKSVYSAVRTGSLNKAAGNENFISSSNQRLQIWTIQQVSVWRLEEEKVEGGFFINPPFTSRQY